MISAYINNNLDLDEISNYIDKVLSTKSRKNRFFEEYSLTRGGTRKKTHTRRKTRKNTKK